MPRLATADDVLGSLDAVMAAALAVRAGGGGSGDEGSGDDVSLVIEDDDSDADEEGGVASGATLMAPATLPPRVCGSCASRAGTCPCLYRDSRAARPLASMHTRRLGARGALLATVCADGADDREARSPAPPEDTAVASQRVADPLAAPTSGGDAAAEPAAPSEPPAASQGAVTSADAPAAADAASQSASGLAGRRAEGQQRRKDAFATMIKVRACLPGSELHLAPVDSVFEVAHAARNRACGKSLGTYVVQVLSAPQGKVLTYGAHI